MDFPTDWTSWLALGSLPLIAALIGWLTNRVAIHMLFHPRQPVKFLGLSAQGLIPHRQPELAQTAGEVIEREILSGHLLREHLEKLPLEPVLDDMVSSMVRDGLGTRLRGLPFIGNFINDSTIERLRGLALEEARLRLPTLRKRMAEAAEQNLDIHTMVEERIAAFDLETLERVVHRVASREFRAIEILGGVLGFIVGLVQLGLLLLTGLIATG